MEEQKTTIFFLIGIKKFLLIKNRFYFDLKDRILSDICLKSKKIFETGDVQIYLNEFKIDANLDIEKDLEYIKINLDIADLPNEQKNLKKYEVLLPYSKNRPNFIFGLKIGNLINKKNLSDSKFEQYNINLNNIFDYYHSNIMKEAVELQADYLENLAKDMWSFLKNNKTEKFKIHFEVLFFILKYAKDKSLDISDIIDLIYQNNIEFYNFNIIKKEEINEFLKEIFSNYESDDKSWPFNFIKEKEKEEEERNEEVEEENEKTNKLNDNNQAIYSIATKNEILFIAFFLGYLSETGGKEEDYKIFFLNEKIKNITIQTLSKIKNIKSQIIVGFNCRKIFMGLCDGNNEILGALQMEKDLLKYFELINAKFNDLYELTEKVSINYYIESSIIKVDEDLDNIVPIY